MAVPSRRQQQRALRVRNYLLLHLREPITLYRTGEALGMSASTIQRALRERWGIGFHEQLDRLRVERFLKMLADEPDLKIEPFAPDVGWQSKANLYASVLRVTSYSLSALRADHALLSLALRALAAGKSARVRAEPAGQKRSRPEGGRPLRHRQPAVDGVTEDTG